MMSDVIVVGSGASAAHAAFALVEAGRSVTMIDVGYEDSTYQSLVPDAPFAEIRRTDRQQHRYFLGDDCEGVPLGQLGAGPQVTPPRQYVLRHADKLTPTISPDFAALESLALGGLGGAWGAVSFPYLDNELVKTGLDPQEMRTHYETVAKRIGISGDRDDLLPIRGPLDALQPALDADHNAAAILGRYAPQRDRFQNAGLYLGRSLLAALSQPIGDRRAHALHDMDFWSNAGGSVYRPDLTVRELQTRRNFRYERGWLVETFSEDATGAVTIHARRAEGRETQTFTARRVVLAAGALGTTRIVLRSLRQYDVPVPLTCNSHTYAPCIHYRGLGKSYRDRCHSLAQLTMIYDPSGDREHLVQGQLYSYRSLLLFRLMKEAPLPYRENLRVMRALASSFVIWVIQHEDAPSADCTCALRRDDTLAISYRPSAEVESRQRAHERVMMKFMRRLGCWPLKTVHPGHGSSVHYGSQLPFDRDDKPLTTEPGGRLRGTRQTYIGDGAAFAYLPAKGLTFTLMANANRIGTDVARALQN